MNAVGLQELTLKTILAEETESAICTACGTQYEPGITPSHCPICEDGRQYVPPGGQEWTSMHRLRENGSDLELRALEANLFGLAVRPAFAIGHRALIVQTTEGNLMWDAVPIINEQMIHRVQEIGGIRAIASSHPHFYTAMVGWSRVFGDIPIHLPESARDWLMRTTQSIEFYKGDSREIFGGISLHRTGGHFACSQVALWPDGANQKGALFSTDEPAVNPGGNSVSFMYSFPNSIPLDEKRIQRVLSILKPLKFDRIYSGWWDKVIQSGGSDAVDKSGRQYLDILQGKWNPATLPPSPRFSGSR